MSDGRCTEVYVGGYRRGQRCPYRATAIVSLAHAAPFLVCGYHTRAYSPDVVYPLDWSLATIRRFQRNNLAALEGGSE